MSYPLSYSLWSRCRGAFQGAVLGEVCSRCELPSKVAGTTGRLMRAGMTSLVQSQGFEGEAWQRATREARPALGQGPYTATALAIATLPLAVFFHDQTAQWQQNLRQVLSGWQAPPSTYPLALTWGTAIALALRGQLPPQAFIPELIATLKAADLDSTEPLPGYLQTLMQVQRLEHQRASLAVSLTALAGHPQLLPYQSLAIALFCFLTTPEDGSLSLGRALRVSQAYPYTATLTGALAGAFGGTESLPLTWKLKLQTSPAHLTQLQKTWQLSSLADLDRHTTQLLGLWSGAYDPTTWDTTQPRPSFAAPGILRQNLVSQ